MDDFMKELHTREDGTLTFGDIVVPWSTYTWPDHMRTLTPRPQMRNPYASESQDDWQVETVERLRNLKIKAVRKGLVEYKVALQYATEIRIIHDLNEAQSFEEEHGLGAKSMRFFHDLLTGSFEGEMELLFELFMGVDRTENLILDNEEIRELILLLDPNASNVDVVRYMNEVNLFKKKGELNYVALLDWWNRTRTKEDSIVAQKGTAFLLLLKARSVSSGLFRYAYGLADLEKKWRKLAKKEPPKLHRLRESYRHAFVELRRYKLKLHLTEAEESCLRPSHGHKDSSSAGFIVWDN